MEPVFSTKKQHHHPHQNVHVPCHLSTPPKKKHRLFNLYIFGRFEKKKNKKLSISSFGVRVSCKAASNVPSLAAFNKAVAAFPNFQAENCPKNRAKNMGWHGTSYKWPKINGLLGVVIPTYRGVITPFITGKGPSCTMLFYKYVAG